MDALLWTDLSLTVDGGQWHCIDLGCELKHTSTQLPDLLWQHLAEPLLAYLNQIPNSSQICVYGGEAEGYTVAQIEKINASHKIEPVACWPIVAPHAQNAS